MTRFSHGGDIYTNKCRLDFSANINPLGMPKSVLAAAISGATESTAYPDPYCRELRKLVSAEENVEEDMLIFGNGAADLIFRAVLAIKPKKALIPVPSFSEYEAALDSVGCEKEFYFLDAQKDFILDKEFIDRLTADIDIVFLCSPNNPTGKLIPREMLENILYKCNENNIVVIADFCFMDFTEEELMANDLFLITSKIIIIKAFTKMYAMPGLRLGYGICQDLDIIRKIEETGQAWSVSIPAQKAGIAATLEKDFPKETRDMIAREREYLLYELQRLGFHVIESHANFILFFSPKPLYDVLLDYGILIRSCENFRGLNDKYFRTAIKTHSENMQLMESLKRIMAGENNG